MQAYALLEPWHHFPGRQLSLVVQQLPPGRVRVGMRDPRQSPLAFGVHASEIKVGLPAFPDGHYGPLPERGPPNGRNALYAASSFLLGSVPIAPPFFWKADGTIVEGSASIAFPKYERKSTEVSILPKRLMK